MGTGRRPRCWRWREPPARRRGGPAGSSALSPWSALLGGLGEEGEGAVQDRLGIGVPALLHERPEAVHDLSDRREVAPIALPPLEALLDLVHLLLELLRRIRRAGGARRLLGAHEHAQEL